MLCRRRRKRRTVWYRCCSTLCRAVVTEPPHLLDTSAPGRQILAGPDPTDPFMLTVGNRYLLYTSEGTSTLNVPLRTGPRPGVWSKPTDVLPELRDEGLLEFRRGRGVTVSGPAPDRSVVIWKARELVALARRHGYGLEELNEILREAS